MTLSITSLAVSIGVAIYAHVNHRRVVAWDRERKADRQ